MTKKDRVIINDLMAEYSANAIDMLKNGDKENAAAFIGGRAALGELIEKLEKLKKENTKTSGDATVDRE